MPALSPTFVFDDDGKAYAYVAGKIVASSDDADDLERKLAALPPFLDEEDKEEDPEEDDKKTAKVVVTPNGLKGTVLGKQKGLWGDQVTIRLENGRIAKYDVTDDSKMKYYREKTAAALSPIAGLRARLDAMPEGTKESLTARIKELKAIKREASTFIKSASYSDGETLDNIVVHAEYEMREVTDALAKLADAESFIPTAPFAPSVAEQESIGGSDGGWLEDTAERMIAENEAQDFDALMEEGPETFVAELETPVLEDGPLTGEYADQFVSSKTAGLNQEATADFRKHFLARVEEVRKVELDGRKEEVEKIAKEAATENYDGDAEGLFL